LATEPIHQESHGRVGAALAAYEELRICHSAAQSAEELNNCGFASATER